MLALLLFLPVCLCWRKLRQSLFKYSRTRCRKPLSLNTKTGKKGDIIQLNKLHVALCVILISDYHYDGKNQLICVYLGVKRALREGTKLLIKYAPIRTVIANFIHYPAINWNQLELFNQTRYIDSLLLGAHKNENNKKASVQNQSSPFSQPFCCR